MDPMSIVKDLVGSETVLISLLLTALFLYKKIVEPRLLKLKEYEDAEKLKLISQDTFEKGIDDLEQTLCNVLEQKLSAISTIDDVATVVDDVKALLRDVIKDDVYKIKSIIESMQLNFKEHDGRYDGVELSMDKLVKISLSLYKTLDRLITEMEFKGLIDKIERIDIESVSDISSDQLANILKMVNTLVKEEKKGSRVRRLSQ